MLAASIPPFFNVPFGNSAGAGFIRTIPVASQIGITPGAASLTDGFPPLTFLPVSAGGVPPFGQDVNGIFNEVTANLQWYQAGGTPQYNSAFSTAIGGYPNGALLQSASGLGLWRSTVDNNVTNPDAGGAGWVTAFPCGVAGQVRNLAMSVTAASSTATLTADEIIVETALGGQTFRLASFNKTINLATTGAGGMDTGTAPVSGFVALYAIYNPTTQASALLATNAATLQPNVYGGANMPAGYTASALVSVWKTNASSQFSPGFQADRSVSTAQINVLNSTTINASFTSLSMAGAVPLNAKTVAGTATITTSVSSSVALTIASAASGLGQTEPLGFNSTNAASSGASFAGLQLISPQTMFYTSGSSAGTSTFGLNICNYTF